MPAAAGLVSALYEKNMLIAPRQSLLEGTLIRRYQRFITDIRLDNGEVVIAHTPNTGSMMQCAVPGHRVLLSRSNNPSRKLSYTLELVRVKKGWVDVNTHRANRIVEEALRQGTIQGLEGWTVHREVRLGKSRIDFMLDQSGRKAYLEVKNVTLICRPRTACFPDAVTERGARHLTELLDAVRNGHRGIVLFLVQRSEAESFSAADAIDPAYGRHLRTVVQQGVEARAFKTTCRIPHIRLARSIPVVLN